MFSNGRYNIVRGPRETSWPDGEYWKCFRNENLPGTYRAGGAAGIAGALVLPVTPCDDCRIKDGILVQRRNLIEDEAALESS